jgi:HD superfamily phosphodiesterase
MIEFFGDDAKRIGHALKVYGFAEVICKNIVLDAFTRDVVAFSAVLHDVGIPEAERKHGSSAGPYQEIEGPPIARKILAGLGAPENTIDRVCFIIGHHHSYDAVDGEDFQVIVEADFLVNIHEEGISRGAIESVEKKIFKTETGKKLLRIMYLNK